ncbi:MAG: glycosyltransferase, partial [Planctomycetota bacterium]
MIRGTSLRRPRTRTLSEIPSSAICDSISGRAGPSPTSTNVAVVPDNANDPRCQTLYYGVESHPRANDSDRAALRRSIDVAEDSPIVLHVGRFYSQKNHPGLLRVFQRVCQEMSTATLVLVGDGPARPEIESQ